ncbi:MAG: 5'/3'-nucleotidase SurE [Phycisphaerae bacterium]|nr:5'/3'-nucleotidase SurE [Phycisphaerae bacterium]
MRILLSNDDGILAPGLAALWNELRSLGEVAVVAPSSPQSAAAHGITVHGPIVVQRVHVQDAFVGYSVSGRPADCVKLAVTELLDRKPDLVVSGINDGANVSINILYSGTVAAAAEGALLGCPAIAVSMRQGQERDFSRAARLALPIIRRLLDNGLAAGQLINVNLPDLTPGDPKGIRVVPQATRTFRDRFTRHTGPDQLDYYWLSGGDFDFTEKHEAEGDLDAVDNGYIAITPLQFDLTEYDLMRHLATLKWEQDVAEPCLPDGPWQTAGQTPNANR